MAWLPILRLRRTKGENTAIIPRWVESGRRRFGSDMRARFAASAKLPCRLPITGGSGFVTVAAVQARNVSTCISFRERAGSASFSNRI